MTDNTSIASPSHEAFLVLYEPIHPRLQKFIQTQVWNNEEAEDILSDVVLITLEKFNHIQHPERLLYYMFGVASHLIQRKWRRNKFIGIFNQERAESIPDALSAEQQILHKELYAFLAKLNTKQREALVLFEINGFSINEIADIQQLSESGVKSNLKRAREKLQRLMLERSTTTNSSHSSTSMPSLYEK